MITPVKPVTTDITNIITVAVGLYNKFLKNSLKDSGRILNKYKSIIVAIVVNMNNSINKVNLIVSLLDLIASTRHH